MAFEDGTVRTLYGCDAAFLVIGGPDLGNGVRADLKKGVILLSLA